MNIKYEFACVKESRLSSRIAEGLKISPEWLIYGRGEMISPKIYKIPLISDFISLQMYLNDRELDDDIKILLTHRFLGIKPFAVKVDANKVCICSNTDKKNDSAKFLSQEFLFYDERGFKLINNERNEPVGEKIYTK